MVTLAFREEEGKAWITFKIRGQKGERATLKPMYSIEENFAIRANSEKFQIQEVKARTLIVRILGQENTFKVVAPYATHDSIHTKNVVTPIID